jgi:hypothetical protein
LHPELLVYGTVGVTLEKLLIQCPSQTLFSMSVTDGFQHREKVVACSDAEVLTHFMHLLSQALQQGQLDDQKDTILF